jgi:hypothetical protein
MYELFIGASVDVRYLHRSGFVGKGGDSSTE